MYLFIITHLGAESEVLCQSLNNHPLISWSRTTAYKHGDDLLAMKNPYAKIFFDQIVHNSTLNPSLNKFCKFIYFIREPNNALSLIDVKNPLRYYCFRLRRIYETARAYPGLVLTADELGKRGNEVWDYLGVKPATMGEITDTDKKIPYEWREYASQRYEHYLGLLRIDKS